MTDIKFKRCILNGKPLPGLYESDICRVEKTPEGWITEVPMRRVGNSAFFEFRPLKLSGAWMRIGTFGVRASAMRVAEQLRDGELVYDSAVARNGVAPIRLVRFTAVAEEIRKTQ